MRNDGVCQLSEGLRARFTRFALHQIGSQDLQGRRAVQTARNGQDAAGQGSRLDDLKRVTSLVYSQLPKDPDAMFEDWPYSEKTAKRTDEEAKAIVDAAYEQHTMPVITR